MSWIVAQFRTMAAS